MIHVVVVTDDHSWVAGHQHEQNNGIDANYGHVVSFYEHLRNTTSTKKDDDDDDDDAYFLVMNGDFMDGTGLSTYPPIHLLPILQSMPWSAVTLGNHDIYKNETVQYLLLQEENDEWLKGGEESSSSIVVTSNVVHNTVTRDPVGKRFLYLRDASTTILVFGFLVYIDTTKVGSPLVRVERVEETVQQDWFLEVLLSGDNNNNNNTKSQSQQSYDAILVLAHMGMDDPDLDIIRKAIRNVVGPDMPLQFLAGHTHLTRFTVMDSCATALEAGKFLETIGLVKFPSRREIVVVENNNNNKKKNCSDLFSHELLPAHVETLAKRVNITTTNHFMTSHGQAMADQIHQTQDSMGLSRVIGCAPHTYHLHDDETEQHSLFGLWRHVLEDFHHIVSSNRAVLQGTRSSFRYDLLEGNITLNDILTVSPFNDTLYLVARELEEVTLVELTKYMNALHPNEDGFAIPDFVLYVARNTTTTTSAATTTTTSSSSSSRLLDLYTLEYEVPFLRQGLQQVLGGTQSFSLEQDDDILPQPAIPHVAATSLWMDFIKAEWSTCLQAAEKEKNRERTHYNNDDNNKSRWKQHNNILVSPKRLLLVPNGTMMLGLLIVAFVVILVRKRTIWGRTTNRVTTNTTTTWT